MYERLIIDSNLEKLVDDSTLSMLENNNINFYFEININDKVQPNTLFLTNDIEKIVDTCQTVILVKNDYDFLNSKNALYIKKIVDIIKIYKQDIVVTWATELQFLAQNTLAYSKNKFDIERAERLREISCEMLSYKYDTPKDVIKTVFASEVGYQTPKIENRAAVIKDNKILLVRESVDGKWALPGGYQDVNMTIRENIIKEASEEAGAIVNPIKTIALLNYNKHHEYSFPLGMLKIFVLCDYIDHNFVDNTETVDAKFFDLDNLPELSQNRTTKQQVEMCFDCYNNKENWEVLFD